MKKLLVALDDSPVAPVVLNHAIELARSIGARLVLFRAVSLPTEIPAEVFIEPQDRLAEIIQQKARHALEALTVRIPADLLAGTLVRVGAPWQAICETAKHEKVDLIVVGSHGYHGLDRLLGTTASKVVNHADRSVLVVRPPVA